MISNETWKDFLKVIFKAVKEIYSEKVVHDAYQEWVAENEAEKDFKEMMGRKDA